MKLLLKESESVAAKVQSEIELEILDSETIYDYWNVLNKNMESLSKTWRNDVVRNGNNFSKML